MPQWIEHLSWVAGIFCGIVLFSETLIKNFKKFNKNKTWKVLDEAFQGFRIGNTIDKLGDSRLEKIAIEGMGNIKISKIKLKNGNEFSITYDSIKSRIIYMEIDWNQNKSGEKTGINGLTFGKTTLSEIRKKYQSNGFSYKERSFIKSGDVTATFNAFELKNSPNDIIIFVTKTSEKIGIEIKTDKKNKVGEIFTLDAIIVSEE
ncbi:hypothetical protein H5A44_10310 [Pectobacterium brasiliense]|uniref:hypothetical protein n=1 Tax=Pectobacterium brasiliense TaxID=180957 RepID=UPI001969B163|nr:hypothetical protein [Pectobacterium brasiliense]MBN3342822.1 hypothetical protein [Pectobacterium brasiliense]